MKIKALRTFKNGAGMFRRGDEGEVSDADAKSLIKRGLASPAKPAPAQAKAKREPETKGKSPATGAPAPIKGE